MKIKINEKELENFLEISSSILPKLWNILMLNLEIINRQLEPIQNFMKNW